MTDQQSGIYDREQQWQHRARNHGAAQRVLPPKISSSQPRTARALASEKICSAFMLLSK
jgi:hypothetical protein